MKRILLMMVLSSLMGCGPSQDSDKAMKKIVDSCHPGAHLSFSYESSTFGRSFTVKCESVVSKGTGHSAEKMF